jgi:hypothetical protein
MASAGVDVGYVTLGIVLTLGAMAASRYFGLSLPTGLGDSSTALYLKMFFQFFANIIPTTILMGGFAADVIRQEVRLSPPAIASLITIAVSGAIGRFFATSTGQNIGFSDNEGSLWCTLPGLSIFESPYLPMAFISTSTIAFYYMFWSANSSVNRSSTFMNAFFGIALVIQLATFAVGDCFSSYFPIFGSILVNIFLALLVGLFVAGCTYGYTSTVDPMNYDPFVGTPTSASGPNAASGSTARAGGYGTGCPAGQQRTALHYCIPCASNCITVGEKCVCDAVDHSQPVQGGDDNTFVAELYKNGQLVTSTIA